MNRTRLLAATLLGCGTGALIMVGVTHPADAGQTRRPSQVPPMTAREVVELIRTKVTCPWQDQTVDTFKAGDPDTPVSGIATTFAATYDVLRRAVDAGCNLIITHEPTFYSGRDDTSALEPDPILDAKRKFIADHKLIVWRFHDHIHRTEPDGILVGMIEHFGWQSLRTSPEHPVFELPEPTSLRQFAASLKGTFDRSVMRVIGDPQMKFTKFGFAMGAPGSIVQMKMLRRDDVEVLVAGETREWETVEYARDASDMGAGKAVILLGHAISEEAGMDHCAKWLRGFLQEMHIKFIPAGDPFWTP